MAIPKSEFLSAFGKAFEIWKSLVDEVKNLGGGDEDILRVKTDGALRKKLAELIVSGKEQVKRLLEFVTTVTVPAVARLVAKDCFKQDVSPEAAVKISCIGDNFKAKFSGKIEVDVPAAELKIHRLCEASLDAPIITALGDCYETTLAHLWTLLSRQPNGEQGVLLVNGYANIFYVRDLEGGLWAVGARWYGGGWYVYACSVEYPGRWCAGRQVFSC